MRIIENDDIPNDNEFDYSEENQITEEAEIIFEEPEEEISNFSADEASEDIEEDSETEIEEIEKEVEEIYSDSSLDPSVSDDEEESEDETDEEDEDSDSQTDILDLLLSEEEQGEEVTEEEMTQEEADSERFFPSLWKNKRRRAKLAYAFVSLVLILVGTAYGFVNAMLDKVQADDTPTHTGDDIGEEIIYDEDDFELFSAVNSAGSVNDYISQWYDSGESMYSKNVINVLLVGLDTKTKKIHMVSLFRDTWAKFIPPGGNAQFGKMNGSYRYGGINCTVQTIERMFKIKIDHYAIVDFRNFKKIINAVGGVDLYVQEYEAKNMKREWDIDVEFSKDENDLVHLNGEQAFWFARQRHSDGDADVSRTRRQRQVITALINSCKGASISQLSEALNSVFSFIKTDLTKTEILGYATKALAWGWLNYPIETIQISDNSIFQTPTLFGASIVIQDYPKVAQIIQEGLYGTSNIVLEDGRRIIFSLYR